MEESGLLLIMKVVFRFFSAFNTEVFFPQHFLNLRPLPQIQGSLRPIFGVSRVMGVFGGQQLVSLQQGSLSLSISLGNSSLLSLIYLGTLEN